MVMVVSMQSMPHLYKKYQVIDRSRGVSVVESCYQATTGENIANLVCAMVRSRVHELESVVTTCRYNL
jgi:hypothetical protein